MYACWRLRGSRSGNWIQSAGTIEVSALLPEAAGGVPGREVGADLVLDFRGKLGRVGDEGVGRKTTKRAALTCVESEPETGGIGETVKRSGRGETNSRSGREMALAPLMDSQAVEAETHRPHWFRCYFPIHPP